MIEVREKAEGNRGPNKRLQILIHTILFDFCNKIRQLPDRWPNSFRTDWIWHSKQVVYKLPFICNYYQNVRFMDECVISVTKPSFLYCVVTPNSQQFIDHSVFMAVGAEYEWSQIYP